MNASPTENILPTENTSASDASAPLISQWLESLWLERGLAEPTQQAYRSDLQNFSAWLTEHVFADGAIDRANSDHLADYLAWQLKSGAAVSSVVRSISALRGFYAWLASHLGKPNISSFLQPVKNPRRLPGMLSEGEVKALLEAVPEGSARHTRDRAMLEMIYAAGLRVSELVSLKREQLDMDRGVVRLFGKGARERLAIVGEEALHWHRHYLESAWQQLAPGGTHWLYPGRGSGHVTRQTFWHQVRRYARLAGIEAKVSPHSLRHAFATHLLDNGSDLRVIQMLLGHADLSTTQFYTQVGKKQLFELHRRHHPRG